MSFEDNAKVQKFYGLNKHFETCNPLTSTFGYLMILMATYSDKTFGYFLKK